MSSSYYDTMKMVFEHYNEFLGLNASWHEEEGREALLGVLDKAKEFIAACAEHAHSVAQEYLVFPKLRLDSNGSIDLIYEEMNGNRFLSLNISNDDRIPYFGHDEHGNTINGVMKYSEPKIAPLLFWRI